MAFRTIPACLIALSLCTASAYGGDRATSRSLLDQAHELFQVGRFRESLHAVNDSIAEDSHNGLALALRARLWHTLNDPVHAREDAARALSQIGGGRLDADALIAQSGAYLIAGDPNKALQSADAAVAASREGGEALAARARAFVELSQLSKAAADLDSALKTNPKVPMWLYARGRVRYELGDNTGAVADLTSALRVNKNFTIAFGLIGASLARQGDYARARKAYDRALSLDGEYSYAYLGRAAIHLRQNDEAAAIKDFESAVRANAQDYAPYLNRGEAHWRAGRREQALADYRSALAAPKLNGDAALLIGDRYMSLQLWHDAADAYTRAHDLGLDHAAIQGRAPALKP